MFCNKNKEKNHIQRNFAYFPLHLFHWSYLLKKNKPQKTGHQNNKVAKKLI